MEKTEIVQNIEKLVNQSGCLNLNGLQTIAVIKYLNYLEISRAEYKKIAEELLQLTKELESLI